MPTWRSSIERLSLAMGMRLPGRPPLIGIDVPPELEEVKGVVQTALG